MHGGIGHMVPLGRHPLGRHPLGRHFPLDGQCVGSTHPTGMHSCIIIVLLSGGFTCY